MSRSLFLSALVLTASAHAATNTEPLDFDYQVVARAADRPALIFNDGLSTYIQPRPGQVVQADGALQDGPYWVIDGVPDVVYGPYWFAGPDYREKREIYPAKAQNRERYADCFFSWVFDFNNDGWGDVLTAGFPGTPALVYENPRREGFDKHWTRHQVLDSVSNESPQLTNLVGDERPLDAANRLRTLL